MEFYRCKNVKTRDEKVKTKNHAADAALSNERQFDIRAIWRESIQSLHPLCVCVDNSLDEILWECLLFSPSISAALFASILFTLRHQQNFSIHSHIHTLFINISTAFIISATLYPVYFVVQVKVILFYFSCAFLSPFLLFTHSTSSSCRHFIKLKCLNKITILTSYFRNTAKKI